MQPEYLARLSESVKAFVDEVEMGAGINVNVRPDPDLNNGGPSGQGNLAVVIDVNRIHLFAPTNGYFPDGAVRHELLHAKRFHIEGVPKLVLAEHAVWDRGLFDSLGSIDNAIEHLVIVPLELKLNPERKDHWDAVMHDVCLGLPYVPEGELPLAVCLHWTFLRQVLPGSPHLDRVREIAIEHALLGMAGSFADRFLSVVASKEEMVRLLFHTFPELPKRHAAFDYISKSRGIRQEPIP